VSDQDNSDKEKEKVKVKHVCGVNICRNATPYHVPTLTPPTHPPLIFSPERLQEEDLRPPDYRGGLDRYGRPLRSKEEAALWKATNKNKQQGNDVTCHGLCDVCD
jgi:hypothetical protein